MSGTTPTLNEPGTLKLLDSVFDELKPLLTDGLSWLTAAYGKAQRLIERKDGALKFYPAIYANNRDHLKLLPDEHLGNFSFFDVDPTQTIDFYPHSHNVFTAEFGLVFWFDLETIYNEDARTIENVKADILRLLTSITTTSAKIQIETVTELAELIYPGYSIEEIEDQFLMYPFAGLRFDGIVTYKEFCP